MPDHVADRPAARAAFVRLPSDFEAPRGKGFEGIGQVPRRLEALLGGLVETAQHDLLERPRHPEVRRLQSGAGSPSSRAA